MKIIFITREGYKLSGARLRCYGFARELRKYGVEAEVLSFADTLGAKYGEEEFRMGASEKIKYNIKAFKKLREACDGSVIFMQRLNYHSLAPFLISLLRGNKFIFDCDDWDISENPVYYMGFYPSSKMEYLTRKIAKFSSTCVVASKFLKEYLEKLNLKVHYIPTGVDTDVFLPKNGNCDNRKITFAWIGTAYHRQMGDNIEFILDVFSSLADKYRNIFLDIAGEGKYYNEIKNGLENLRHRNRIKFHDWILPENVPDFLSSIDIGLLPLIQDTKFNRAKSPTKLFEYMAMKKPVVSSDIGEANCIIKNGENGLLAKSKEEFMDKMKILIEDPDLRLEIGKNSRKDVENSYSLNVLGKQLYGILKGIDA